MKKYVEMELRPGLWRAAELGKANQAEAEELRADLAILLSRAKGLDIRYNRMMARSSAARLEPFAALFARIKNVDLEALTRDEAELRHVGSSVSGAK